MTIQMPKPIELFFAAENAGDADSVAQYFTADATVRDESHTHEGLAAIRDWKRETKRKYNHTSEPLEATERDGRTIVKSRITGNFPGSPVTLEFGFALEGGKITSLVIG